MIKRLIFLFLLMFAASQADATIYYIATTGDDSRSCATASNIATPKRTLSSAVSSCGGPGHIVYARGGTYVGIENNVTYIPSGTSYSNPSTIAAYPGESVTLTQASENGTLNLTSPTLKYVVFKDFRIGNSAIVFFDTVSYIKLENLTHIGNTGNSCVGLNDARTHHIWITGGSYGNCGSYGMYVEGADNIIENLIIHNTGMNGNLLTTFATHIFTNYAPFNTPNRNIIRRVVAYNTGGILAWRGDSNEIYNNIIYDSNVGISVRGNATNTKIYNNTVVRPITYAFDLEGSFGTDFKNNLHWGGTSNSFNLGTTIITQSHSLCYVSGCTGAGAMNGVDPQFINEGANNFRLGPSSPMKNAGTDVGLPCSGGCAIGAFDPAEIK